MTFVLDSSAVLRYLDDEPGANRVSDIIKGHLAGRGNVMLSAVHWGEIAAVSCRVRGIDAAESALSYLSAFGLEVVPATAERAVRAGFLKAQTNVPYADAFGVELASSQPDSVLVTADFDLKKAAGKVEIEFLPTK